MKQNLKNLQEESISIIRDTISYSERPVVLFSIGKDSTGLLDLFKKAYYPSKIPVKFLHIDTGWKFKEMIKFKFNIAKKYNIDLDTYQNKKDFKKVNPFHDSNYTDLMKTKALKDALDKSDYDFVYGGARRDEEGSRSKEKILSHRTNLHIWKPESQRLEPWHIFNLEKKEQESFRVFPLSNWTEINIWEYIKFTNLKGVPLYFAKERKVVVRNDEIFLYDDDRFKLMPDDKVKKLKVRFRTLGCYPLTAGVESKADNVDKIILELKKSRNSERAGRKIDLDRIGSMELKKREGYF